MIKIVYETKYETNKMYLSIFCQFSDEVLKEVKWVFIHILSGP